MYEYSACRSIILLWYNIAIGETRDKSNISATTLYFIHMYVASYTHVYVCPSLDIVLYNRYFNAVSSLPILYYFAILNFFKIICYPKATYSLLRPCPSERPVNRVGRSVFLVQCPSWTTNIDKRHRNCRIIYYIRTANMYMHCINYRILCIGVNELAGCINIPLYMIFQFYALACEWLTMYIKGKS